MFDLYRPWLEARCRLGERDERGGPLVEYIILMGFVVMICVIVIKVFGGTIKERYSATHQIIQGCQPGAHACGNQAP